MHSFLKNKLEKLNNADSWAFPLFFMSFFRWYFEKKIQIKSFFELLTAGGTYGIMAISKNMAIQVQNLNKAVSIPHSTHTLVKGMNPTILSPAKSKYLGKLGSLTLVW